MNNARLVHKESVVDDFLSFAAAKGDRQQAARKMGVAADYVSRTRIGAYFHSARESRKLILLIVAVALLLDNMLLTTVGT